MPLPNCEPVRLPDELRRRREYTPELARAVRRRAGATQGDVAQHLDVMPHTVWRWEAGRQWPRGELLTRYLQLLDELDALR